MANEALLGRLDNVKETLERSSGCLKEEHSAFVPAEGMYTAAQQVAHIALIVDWFMDGAFSPKGFDMDFASHETEVRKIRTLSEAKEWVDRSFAQAKEIIAPGIMGGFPRHILVGGIEEHTAHHRGALTVYSRLLGLVPAMPYMVEA